jgi:hypothetical protein
MRYIDTADFEPPEDWIRQAEEALRDIAALTPAERAKAINKRNELWKALKPGLMALSDDKCWYCESKDLRSDNAVDHFRPKNNVKGSERFPLVDDHPGYWWLAFDYTNYRFSCTLCNSIRKDLDGTTGGKQDYFPLMDEERRCIDRDGNLEEEQPVLLDPTRVLDVGALCFDDAGKAAPRAKRLAESDAAYRQWEDRASESIRFYHLNHHAIVEARYSRIRYIRRVANKADKSLDRMQRNVAGAEAEVQGWLEELKQAISPKSEYSAAVISILKGMRETSAAAYAVLDTL